MLIKKMKLRELRPFLTADKLNLYVEIGVPIKFELWHYSNINKLSEYRYLDKVDIRENDTMFLDYGEYIIEEIGIEEDGAMYIGIHKN